MSATYNWRYKAGSTINYRADSLVATLATSADNVRPSNAAYVALYGNDTTGNGSRQYPYRTISKASSIAIATNDFIVIGSGTYRETITGIGISKIFVGDGDVILDGTGFSSISSVVGCYYHNLIIKNFQNSNTNSIAVVNCTFIDMNGSDLTSTTVIGCTFIRIYANGTSGAMLLFPRLNNDLSRFANNTFIECGFIAIIAANVKYQLWNLIFYRCNIHFIGGAIVSYSLFYQCNFRFGNTYATNFPSAVYPVVPTTFAQINTIADLNTAQNTAFPLAPLKYDDCVIADPAFNNTAIGDYSLQSSSPAKNLSYLGTYVGARSIAYPIKASATESTGAFEFASAINLTLGDNNITLTNPALDAQIDTKVILNTLGRELANFQSYGFNADRNGQYVDSIADLDAVTKAAGDTLAVPASYLVETGAIVYNSVIHTAGARLTTVTGQTTFTTSTGGVLREILEAPQRHTVMARFSDGGASVAVGDALVVGYYYYVLTGSVTYDAVVYSAGETFKAIDTTAFSGAGTVMVAFSTESYQHYEPGIRPTSNNTGDTRTGAIIRGNGDPAYARGGIGVTEFPINAKFIQIRYYIRVNNLKP